MSVLLQMRGARRRCRVNSNKVCLRVDVQDRISKSDSWMARTVYPWWSTCDGKYIRSCSEYDPVSETRTT